MPKASIVVPAYNSAGTIAETLRSLLSQTFEDFEVIIVDDGSTDALSRVVGRFTDPRIRVVRQVNRGLAGARNTGIDTAQGAYIGFCDSDDCWLPGKLAAHVALLDERPEVGLSYSGSAMIDSRSRPMGLSQRPKCEGVQARDVLLRNPVGNGSAPVIRRAALDDIAFRPAAETQRDWWFDETFRQSEDIECWIRLALTTRWEIAGIDEDLTLYRINPGGLSSSITRQLESWERMAAKVEQIDPAFADQHLPAARAYQLRYLARRAVSMANGQLALELIGKSVRQSIHPVLVEPIKTVTTVAAALVLIAGGRRILQRVIPGVSDRRKVA